jgi:fructan beta-fructosidase
LVRLAICGVFGNAAICLITSLPQLNYTLARGPFHIIFDKSIVEVFANDGATVITAQVFPTNEHNNIESFSEKGFMHLSTARLWPLNSALEIKALKG